MKAAGKFTRGGNNGTRTCVECGTRRQVANMEGQVCIDCYEKAGTENAIADGMATCAADFFPIYNEHAWSCDCQEA